MSNDLSGVQSRRNDFGDMTKGDPHQPTHRRRLGVTGVEGGAGRGRPIGGGGGAGRGGGEGGAAGDTGDEDIAEGLGADGAGGGGGPGAPARGGGPPPRVRRRPGEVPPPHPRPPGVGLEQTSLVICRRSAKISQKNILEPNGSFASWLVL